MNSPNFPYYTTVRNILQNGASLLEKAPYKNNSGKTQMTKTLLTFIFSYGSESDGSNKTKVIIKESCISFHVEEFGFTSLQTDQCAVILDPVLDFGLLPIFRHEFSHGVGGLGYALALMEPVIDYDVDSRIHGCSSYCASNLAKATG